MTSFGLLGDVVAILIAPSMIRFRFQAPTSAGGMLATNAAAVLEFGMHWLIVGQVIGTVAGVLLGLLVAILLWRRDRRKASLTNVSEPAKPKPA
jgi:hypothetical protein